MDYKVGDKLVVTNPEECSWYLTHLKYSPVPYLVVDKVEKRTPYWKAYGDEGNQDRSRYSSLAKYKLYEEPYDFNKY